MKAVDFQSLREAVEYLKANKQERGGHVYEPMPFAEFNGLRVSSNAGQHRKAWELIRTDILATHDSIGGDEGPMDNLIVLDVGANMGFYTFSAALEGARVLAYEPQPVYSAVARAIIAEKDSMSRKVWWQDKPFDDGLSGLDASAAFLLSTFNWMADGGRRMDEAMQELTSICHIAPVMYFEQGWNKGKNCLRTKAGQDQFDACVEVGRDAGYKDFLLLGDIRVWGYSRPLIRCSR